MSAVVRRQGRSPLDAALERLGDVMAETRREDRQESYLRRSLAAHIVQHGAEPRDPAAVRIRLDLETRLAALSPPQPLRGEAPQGRPAAAAHAAFLPPKNQP